MPQRFRWQLEPAAPQVEGLIPDQLYPQRNGTTDTEAIFLAIMGAGIENPVAATENVLMKLTELVNQTKPADRLRVTAALSNGSDLYAFRYAVNDRPTRCITGNRMPAS